MTQRNQNQSNGNGRQRNELARVKEETVGAVEKRIGELIGNHQLVLPDGYSVGNALQAAWLTLQEVKDKNKKPALEVCTRNSIVQSLFSMAVQALDPGKKQCYFLAYGSSLVCQRSYFGTIAVAKRMAGVLDAFAEIVYQGDELEYEIDRGRKRITQHKQRLENIDDDNIRAAYAVITFDDPRKAEHTELMTFDQLQAAWSKSQMNPKDEGSTHRQFASEMAKKTVLSRALKRHINSSSDDHLFLREFNRSTVAEAEGEMAEEVEAHANRQLVDTDPATIDVEAAADPEPVPEAEAEAPAEEPETAETAAEPEPAAEAEQAPLGPGF